MRIGDTSQGNNGANRDFQALGQKVCWGLNGPGLEVADQTLSFYCRAIVASGQRISPTGNAADLGLRLTVQEAKASQASKSSGSLQNNCLLFGPPAEALPGEQVHTAASPTPWTQGCRAGGMQGLKRVE